MVCFAEELLTRRGPCVDYPANARDRAWPLDVYALPSISLEDESGG